MSGGSAGSRRKLLVVAALCFVAVVAVSFVNERVSGRLSWRLPDGGRIHLARVGGQYTLTKVANGGGMATLYIDSADDLGGYWLVDRARRKIVGFFAASDGMRVGAVPDPTPPATFTLDRGRVVERSNFFGIF